MQIQTSSVKKLSPNSEFFTVVFQKGSQGTHQGFFQPIKKLQLPSKLKVDLDQYHQLLIQTCYLVFTCSRQKLQLIITPQDDLLFDTRHTKNAIHPQLTFFLRYEINQASSTPRPAKQFAVSLLDEEIAYGKKFSVISQNPTFMQFEEEFRIVRGLSLGGEKGFMLGLEETEMFRKYAFLLKLQNCMLMNVMKVEKGLMEKFFEAQKQEIELVTRYKQAKQNKQPSKMLQTNKSITTLLTEFFTSTLSTADKFLRIDKPTPQQKPSQLSLTLHLTQKKLGLPLFARKAGRDMIQHQSDFKRSELEYWIEYSSEKNLIDVRLVTDLVMGVEISDFVLYQCNRLTFDCTEVCIDIVERPFQGGQKCKLLALRSEQMPIAKEPVLQTILLMVDRTMIIYKIVQPYLSRIITRDNEIPDEAFRRIHHYLSLFKVCSNCVYSKP